MYKNYIKYYNKYLIGGSLVENEKKKLDIIMEALPMDENTPDIHLPKNHLLTNEEIVDLSRDDTLYRDSYHWIGLFLPIVWFHEDHECFNTLLEICSNLKDFLIKTSGKKTLFCPGDSPIKFVKITFILFPELKDTINIVSIPFSYKEPTLFERNPHGSNKEELTEYLLTHVSLEHPIYLVDYSFKGHTINFIKSVLPIVDTFELPFPKERNTLHYCLEAIYNAENYIFRCSDFYDKPNPSYLLCNIFLIFVVGFYNRGKILPEIPERRKIEEFYSKKLPTELSVWFDTNELRGIYPVIGKFIINHHHVFTVQNSFLMFIGCGLENCFLRNDSRIPLKYFMPITNITYESLKNYYRTRKSGQSFQDWFKEHRQG